MTIKLNSGDYFIARHKGKPTLLVKLDGGYRGTIERTLKTDEPETVTYDPEQVMCSLGSDPIPSTYCSVKVRPYVRTIQSAKYGPIHICTKLDNKDKKKLSNAMQFVYDWFLENATLAFLPLHEIVLYPPQGKYAGCYKMKTRGSDTFDSIELHPKTFDDEQFNRYLVAHEFAHGFFFRCVPKSIRARWMKLYQKRLKLSKVKHTAMEQLWESVARYEGGITAFLKESADDESALLIKEVIGYFRRKHKMSASDLNMMMDHNPDLVKELWPSTAVLTEERPDMGEYAMKSYEEMFAEAMAYHITGRKVPKDILQGIEYTLSKCKRSISED